MMERTANPGRSGGCANGHAPTGKLSGFARPGLGLRIIKIAFSQPVVLSPRVVRKSALASGGVFPYKTAHASSQKSRIRRKSRQPAAL